MQRCGEANAAITDHVGQLLGEDTGKSAWNIDATNTVIYKAVKCLWELGSAGRSMLEKWGEGL